MSTLQSNDFASYTLTDKEQEQGSLLTTAQKQVIQNHLSGAAVNRINLDYDSTNPIQFAQDEAFLKGQIAAFRLMLDTSEATEEDLNQSTINLDSEG